MRSEEFLVKVHMNLLAGGFGKVKVAKNKKTGKYVALKLLNKG
jgi:serine/threonine protein kinase